MDDYDVFLNHRGRDVKGAFAAHLYDALRSAGLNPFLDKKCLVKGSPAFGSIKTALEVAKVHVAIISKGYAESKYCLSELVAVMRSGKPVIPVFYDVEPAELRRVETGPFAAAFKKHRLRESAERLQEWTDALRKLADITGFVFYLSNYQGDEAQLKRDVVDAILSLLPSKDALQVESRLFGLEEQVKICINKLEKMSCATNLLGLVGMGGIGKSTLAKEIYNHFINHNKFQATSFLEIDCNRHSNLEGGSSLLNTMREQLLRDLLHIIPKNDQHINYKYWFHKFSSQGPILIVLDDIQDKAQFDKLIINPSLLASGSCIIVTSRNRHLLQLVGKKSYFYLHDVIPLRCQESQKLFNWHAFGDEEAPENFKDLANDVSKACNGLPLALKVVGSNLFGKTSDEDRNNIWPEAIDVLKRDPDVINALKRSYDNLSEPEKLMFVDIACVFCGWWKQEALEIWQNCKECSICCGNGTPYTSLRHLIDKSLVVLECYGRGYILTMHSLLQSMGQTIGEVQGSHLWKGKATKVVEEHNKNSKKVRAMNLANSGKHNFGVENFTKMQNLHFLILDGCDVNGNLGNISKELRYLRWRNLPLTQLPPMLNLSKLISLDFSRSTKLANIWAKSNPALEGCPNLLRLDLSECTSITTLPDSIGRLSRLKALNLNGCGNLQKLPNCIGQLTALEELRLGWCRSLEALPDTIIALSGLQRLYLESCSPILKLPAKFGLMTGLIDLYINLTTERQAVCIGQLYALKDLLIRECTDKVITMFDRSGTLRNLHQLSYLWFDDCPSITKLPDTLGLLTNLEYLDLMGCEKLRKLPSSIRHLKVLTGLILSYCSSLETLPDSLGALTSLQHLEIVKCTSITKLPMSIGHLSKLRCLWMQGCSKLQSLPDSLRQLNALEVLYVLDCGSCLEGLGLLKALQGLRIWGCTSITKLPGSRLVVVDNNMIWSPAWMWDGQGWNWVRRELKEVRVVEANDCGFLRHVRDIESGQLILQRVHNLQCCKSPFPSWAEWARRGPIGAFSLQSMQLRFASRASWKAWSDPYVPIQHLMKRAPQMLIPVHKKERRLGTHGILWPSPFYIEQII